MLCIFYLPGHGEALESKIVCGVVYACFKVNIFGDGVGEVQMFWSPIQRQHWCKVCMKEIV